MRLATMERPYLGWPETDVYEALGASLIACLPEGWSRADLRCTVIAENVVELAVTATMPDGRGDRAISLREAGDTDGLLLELRERMADSGHGSWNSARFSIGDDHRFDLFFSYE